MFELPQNVHIYRLWRMRRLIAFCLLLPLIPLAVLWTLTGGSAMLTQLGVAGPILVVWTLVVIGIVLRFPRAVFEAAVYCLALVGVILLSPIADFLASQVKGTWGPQHSLGLGFLFLVAGVALVVGIEAALLWLVRAAPRTMRRRSVTVLTRLPAALAFNALRMSPDRVSPVGRIGPADASGRFGVWMDFRAPPAAGPAPPPEAPWSRQSPPTYWMTVKEEGNLTCGMIAEFPNGGVDVTHLGVETHETGARITQTSSSDALTLPVAVLFFLQDADRDYLTGLLDEAEGRISPRANWLQPCETPSQWLLRRLPKESERPFF